MNKKKNERGLFIIAGIISIVLAIVCLTLSTGYYESNKEYGGDAYTGIQQAAAQTANNVQDLTAAVKTGFSSLLFVIGLISIAYGKAGQKTDAPVVNPFAAPQAPQQPFAQNGFVAPQQPVNQNGFATPQAPQQPINQNRFVAPQAPVNAPVSAPVAQSQNTPYQNV